MFNQLCHPDTPKVGTLNLIMENHCYHQPQPNFTEHLLCTDNMLSTHKRYLVQYPLKSCEASSVISQSHFLD